MGKDIAITAFVGLDVHADSIAIAVADAGSRQPARSVGTIPNRPPAIRKALKRLGSPQQLHVCYEAGPCGYGLYRQLREMGIRCEVVAPTLVPVRSGDRVKTDKRDARKLAQCSRAGDLTAVWVPDAAHEALRDLVRAREDAKEDQLRARQRLSKFLLRQERRRPAGTKNWTQKHRRWLQSLRFEQLAHQQTFADYLAEVDHATERLQRLERAIDEAIEGAPQQQREVIQSLQSLRGVGKITAVTMVAEIGCFHRFEHPSQLMAYAGLVPSEHSTGNSKRKGAITKTGNSHVRRVTVEAAWHARRQPNVGVQLKRRQQGQSEAIKQHAWKAQHRLHDRYRRMTGKGKAKQLVVTAVARELLGFIWAIAVQREMDLDNTRAA